jgi:type IV secretion system protein VirB1
MMPGLELLACQDLAVPMEIMEHVVRVESSFNPFAIGVVGARLERQPRTLDEAVATASRLERDGYNFSLGLAQVNRHNLAKQGLSSYEHAFAACPNLAAGARILAECHARAAGDWGKAFSCYYSGNFVRGFRDGYVQKIGRSMAAAGLDLAAEVVVAIPLARRASPRPSAGGKGADLRARRAASATPHAVEPDASGSALNLPAGHGAGDAGNSDAPPRGNAMDGAPFVPRVTGPGASRGRPATPSPLPPPPPLPPPRRGGDAAFVF